MRKISITCLTDISCWLLIFLFVYTATSKLIAFDAFRLALRQSPVIRHFSFIPFLIPATEILVSILLFFKSTRLQGLYGSVALLTLFTTYIGALLAAGKTMPCSCGGVIRQLSWPEHLLFNSFFIVLSLLSIQRLSAKPAYA